MKLIIENWRKFLLQEKSSNSALTKLVKLDNKAKILVQKKIKDIETKHKTKITEEHLKLAGYSIYGSPYLSTSSSESKKAKESFRKVFNRPAKMMVKFAKKINPDAYDKSKPIKARYRHTKHPDFIKLKNSTEYQKARSLRNFLLDIRSGINQIEREISIDFQRAVDDMLGIKKKRNSRTIYFKPMIVAIFTIEKGYKPGSVFGSKYSIDTKSDPFEILERDTVNETNKAIKKMKGSFLWPLVSIFMPDDWEEAARNISRICCHLLRTRFSSGQVSFMGDKIATPSYQFITNFISGRMASEIRQTLGAALGSPMKSLNYLKFNGGDQILQEAVKWINSNKKPTLGQCTQQIDKVLNHMKAQGFQDYEMYISFTASKELLLKVLK